MVIKFPNGKPAIKKLLLCLKKEKSEPRKKER